MLGHTWRQKENEENLIITLLSPYSHAGYQNKYITLQHLRAKVNDIITQDDMSTSQHDA